jgi:uncharacterized membrane protein YedE/YeeE
VIALALSTLAGLLFGAGILVGGMAMPSHVLGFLDPLAGWDLQLVFVMVGALTTYALLSRWIRARRREPWFDASFHVPTRRDLDRTLVLGSAVFGIGWGLSGYCPGPAIVASGGASRGALVVLAGMLVGMAIVRRARSGDETHVSL